MIYYDDFCRSKGCEYFIEWEGGYVGWLHRSCTEMGESMHIKEYPHNCPHKDELVFYHEL